MFCGSRSFSQMEDPSTAMSKPSKLKQSLSMNKKKITGIPNLYSSTGLDKFEKTLAELGSKKEKIMLTVKSQGDATVRFTYKPESDDWIPIIIKPKPTQPKEEKAAVETAKPPKVEKRLSAPPSMKVDKECNECKEGVIKKKIMRRSYGWGVWNWGLVIVLVLVLLMFGRSFAICWMTMCWYLVPMIKERCKSKSRKELGERASEKNLVGVVVKELRTPKGRSRRKR